MAHFVDRDALPNAWPTHLLEDEFVGWLGRSVATFGFLEDQLRRALFALTGTKPTEVQPDESDLAEWDQYLRQQMTNQLGPLILSLDRIIKDDPRLNRMDHQQLFDGLEDALKMRNLICHASWGKSEHPGFYIPRFFNRRLEFCETEIDINFLIQIQKGTAELIADVTDLVTGLGYQFPGSRGPGQIIYGPKDHS